MDQDTRVSVLLKTEDAERFASYCKEKGYKKSSLIVRLIREHLAREGYQLQKDMFSKRSDARHQNG